MNGVNKNIKCIFFYILSRATLNETFRAKYDGVLPRTPTPKSEIYTPKRDDEHPHPPIPITACEYSPLSSLLAIRA